MEAQFLLDTNTFIYIRRERPQIVLQRFLTLQPGESAISVVTLGELMYGIAKSARRSGGLAQLQEMSQMVPVLAMPVEAAQEYGAIRAELETQGKMIGNNDLWIAAHAKVSELTLVTNNEREFRRVRGLKVQNWAV